MSVPRPRRDFSLHCVLISGVAAQASGKGAAPAVAEGLGGVNVKGVEDPKTEGRPGELTGGMFSKTRDAFVWETS